jgi:UDP-N-acetylglucosamine 4,6-dehydratase/5-epimerase
MLLRGKAEHEVREIGTRHGEKLYEVLLSREERAAAEDLKEYFRIPADIRDLNYEKYFSDGEAKITETEDYNSHNTDRLNIDEMTDLLLKLPFMRRVASGDMASTEDLS